MVLYRLHALLVMASLVAAPARAQASEFADW